MGSSASDAYASLVDENRRLSASLVALESELREQRLRESPTRSFLVSIAFSGFTALSMLINLGLSTGHLTTVSESLAWLQTAWWPLLTSILANPAPFYRSFQALTTLQKGLDP